MSRWYASKAAAERGDQRRGGECLVASYVGVVGRDAGRTMMVFGQRAPDGVVTYDIARDVTGRSLAHIDRLARDWIGHGVAPTQDGGRGVVGHRGALALPLLAACYPHEPCPRCRWYAAEARARRVVRR